MFDFDEIVAKIPAAEQYKKNHYYDHISIHCLDPMPRAHANIEIEDRLGRKGTITKNDLTEIVNLNYRQVDYMVEQVKMTGEIPPKAKYEVAKVLKNIKFNF